MSKYNILFYSNNCDASKLLLTMFEKEKLTRFFHMICTDGNIKIPKNIRYTPSLILRGNTKIYEVSEAFSWLARIKQWKNSLQIKNASDAHTKYLNQVSGNLTQDNCSLLGFSESEMNGMSDIFSFFSNNMQNECEDSLPQSYFSVDNIGKEFIFTPPLEDGSYKIKNNSRCKINEKEQKILYQNLKAERDQQDKLIKQYNEEFINSYQG